MHVHAVKYHKNTQMLYDVYYIKQVKITFSRRGILAKHKIEIRIYSCMYIENHMCNKKSIIIFPSLKPFGYA